MNIHFDNPVTIDAKSWFDILCVNDSGRSFKKIITTSKYSKNDYVSREVHLEPTPSQKRILTFWKFIYSKYYNLTNNFYKENVIQLQEDNTIFIIESTYKKYIKSKFNIEKKIMNLHPLGNSNSRIFYKNSYFLYKQINKRIPRQAIEQCRRAYASAISNYKARNIKSFDIKDLDPDSNIFVMNLKKDMFSKLNRVKKPTVDKDEDEEIISKQLIKKTIGCKTKDVKITTKQYIKDNGAIAPNILGKTMASKEPIGIIKCDPILYTAAGKYKLLVPEKPKKSKTGTTDGICGVDPGFRTFLTVYSKYDTYKIGTELSKITRLVDKKTKTINFFRQRSTELGTPEKNSKCRRSIAKVEIKIRNLVKDLHYKAGNFLCKKFKKIKLGKLNTKSIMEKEFSGKYKNYMSALSHGKFRERLGNQTKKHGITLELVNEYRTTMECSYCGNIKIDVGKSKIYECKECGFKGDRDMNAAKNLRDR